jgi:hypothetical protein
MVGWLVGVWSLGRKEEKTTTRERNQKGAALRNGKRRKQRNRQTHTHTHETLETRDARLIAVGVEVVDFP